MPENILPDYIKIDSVSFSYDPSETPLRLALDQLSFEITQGSHVAVLGRNGSGKSTLARLINALEQPLGGQIVVAGLQTDKEEDIWQIRALCGMVFQNPDNQIVATTVEEDVAFGPENLGVPSAEIRTRVDQALAYVGLSAAAKKMPSELSGGQKQKLAIAGVLAMQPKCLILDEATSMLDPQSRRSFMDLVMQLRDEQKITVINITHDMKEVLLADRVFVMHEGKILISGTPPEIFHNVDQIRQLGLDVPIHTAIAYDFARLLGKTYPIGAAATRHGAEAVIRELIASAQTQEFEQAKAQLLKEKPALSLIKPEEREQESVIQVKNLSYNYTLGRGADATQPPALAQINFDAKRAEVLGIMGHSGSGKSTLVQHLNGLLRIQSGEIHVLDYDLREVKDIRAVRRHVSLLFQYPEHQLFAATVREDIAFGPDKMGVHHEEIEQRTKEALRIVRLDEEILDRSPFELSGGQKRRVAIAGILAMHPDILILDEPAAGLDPAGRDEILSYVRQLKEKGTTIILVSHSMEDLARMSDRILVLYHGQQVMLDTPAAIFAQTERVKDYELSIPGSQRFLERFLVDYPELNTARFSASTAVLELLNQVAGTKAGDQMESVMAATQTKLKEDEV